MAKRARKRPDEKVAPRLADHALSYGGKVLLVFGKPLFKLLSGLILTFLYFSSLVGHLTRITLTLVGKLVIQLFFVFPKTLLKSLLSLKPKVSLIKTKPSSKTVEKTLPISMGIITYIAKRYRRSLRWFSLLLKLFLHNLSRIKPPSFPWLKFKLNFPKIILPVKIALVLSIIILVPLLFWLKILKDLPPPTELTSRKPEVSTKIYDRNMVLLYKIYKNQNRTPVNLNDIPLYVRQATLAAEDAEFYNHIGFSLKGISRSIIRNLKKGELTGGSTITQQLIKNALLSSEKTFTRKLKELILSVETEFTYSKDQILEMYLNEVSYGGTAYGIQEASQVYFGKNVGELSLAEAAFLAGLPKSPSKYSPFGENPSLATARQRDVLNLMEINKYITAEQRQIAENQTLTFIPKHTDIKAPHFVMYVKQQLIDSYGEDLVEKGGLEVITTLDYRIQKLAEEAVSSEVKRLANLHVGNGAAVVIHPKTGEILAMVGSKDYFDIKADGNVNVTTSPRQPGSSIKVVNYGYALSHGYSPSTLIDDSPVTYHIAGSLPYTPKNYDGNFRGQITIRSALAESRNIPAVKVLASYGVDNMIEQGKRMGITTWNNPQRYGLSLTLGAAEVKLIDLARVYATVANYGKRPDLTSVIRIKDYRGRIIEENDCLPGNNPFGEFDKALSVNTVFAAETPQDCTQEQVIDSRVAYMLIDILKDNHARIPAFGSTSSLSISNHPEVAVKTGTTNELKDNLTVGFNQEYVVAVWVGNNDSTPMARIASGITGAAPIWNKIMRGLLSEKESIAWQVPSGLVMADACLTVASLACESCRPRQDWFLEEKVPQQPCQSTQIVDNREVTTSDDRESNDNKKDRRGKIVEPAPRTQI